MSKTSSVPIPLLLLLVLQLLTSKSFEDEPDKAEDEDDAVGGEDDRDVELEHADAPSDDPLDEFPLELAEQLTKATTAATVEEALLPLSTTSDAFSIRCRLMTGCPLLFRMDDDEDVDEAEDDDGGVEGEDIMVTSVMALVGDVVVPLSVTSATAVGGAGPGGSEGPRPFFDSFSF